MKRIFLLVIVLIVFLFLLCRCHNQPYHYEGVIVEIIDIDKTGNIFLVTENVLAPYKNKIMVPNSVSIFNDKNKIIAAEDLQIGDIIDADFKKNRQGEYYIVKRIKVYKRGTIKEYNSEDTK